MNELKIIAIGRAGISICKHAVDSGMKAFILGVDKDRSFMDLVNIPDSDFLVSNDCLEDSCEILRDKISNSKMIVIVGGGAGEISSECIPVVAKVALECTEEVCCFMSMPFDFEGTERIERAERLQKILSELGIKCYTCLLQQLMEQGFYKTQREMFRALGESFFDMLKKELIQ